MKPPAGRQSTGKLSVGVLVLMITMTVGQPIAIAQQDGVSGSWSGIWQEGGMSGALEFRLTQAGESVRGSYDSGGGGHRGPLQGVRVYGTLKGDLLILKTYDGQRGFEGRVKGNTISGTYSGKFATKGFDVRRTEK